MAGAFPSITAVTATSKTVGKPIINIVKDLFKNKGVQVGVGLGAAGLGLSSLSSSAKEATSPFGELSPILIIIVVIVILVMMMRSK